MKSSSGDRRAVTVLAILQEARDAGINQLNKTTLVKFIYLLDVFVAEEHNGAQRWTDYPWKFLHFGPFASEILETLDSLVAKASIDVEERGSEGKEFVLYGLPHERPARSLAAIGVPDSARLRLQPAIRGYAFDLPNLLNYVYFRTAPMEDAHPGDDLSFASCRKLDYRNDIRPLTLIQPAPDKVARLRDLFERLERRQRDRVSGELPDQTRDEEFENALRVGENETVAGEETIRTHLELPRRL